ncbi:hypothetical protein [Nostoc sp.]|uniref:hypothetical protein n=1 Tax=Nostoc sp. TaxID=1180 RepID=UPI002FF859B1
MGQKTGLSLSINYQIVVQKHSEVLRCEPELSKETEFWIKIPLYQMGESVSHNGFKLPTDLQKSKV